MALGAHMRHYSYMYYAPHRDGVLQSSTDIMPPQNASHIPKEKFVTDIWLSQTRLSLVDIIPQNSSYLPEVPHLEKSATNIWLP